MIVIWWIGLVIYGGFALFSLGSLFGFGKEKNNSPAQRLFVFIVTALIVGNQLYFYLRGKP